MKICLINSPYSLQERYGEHIPKEITYTLPALGLAYVAAPLEEKHEVEIIDAPAYDYSSDQVVSMVIENKYDVVGFFTVTPTIHTVLEIAKRIKDKNNEIKIVLGGPHASGFSKELIEENDFVDFVVIGEAELSFPELLDNIGKDLSKVNGIAFRKDKKTIVTKQREMVHNLDELPMPARHLLALKDSKRYRLLPSHYKRLPSMHMIASRGCSYGKCTFCFEAGRLGPVCRRRSPEKVIKEIKFLINEYGAKEIAFWDDNFVTNHDWVKEICKKIVDEKLDITWSCSARANFVNKELLVEMKKAGCWSIFYGVESGVQELLDRIKKGQTLDQVRNAVRWTKEVGIEVRGSFMLALPGETPEMGKQTIKFAKELNPDMAQFCITTPFVGTELYDDAKKSGTLSEDLKEFSGNKVVFVPNGYKNAEQISKLQKYAYRSFYLRPRYLLGRVLAIRSVDDIKKYWTGFKLMIGISK